MELYELTAHELINKLETKETNVLEIIKSYLKNIEEKEKIIRSICNFNR